MKTISVETSTHGRVLIREAENSSRPLLLVGFHGYAQSAEDMMEQLELIPGSEQWTLVSIQALHRFYARRQERVVASWMTRQDREQAIEDNVAYVNRVIGRVIGPLMAEAGDTPLVFVGFSQGVAMAYRAAILGTYRSRCIIAVGGDVPGDVRTIPSERFPPILLAAGESDDLYTSTHLESDEGFLRSHGVELDVFRYPGGHEWTELLRHQIHSFLKKQI